MIYYRILVTGLLIGIYLKLWVVQLAVEAMQR